MLSEVPGDIIWLHGFDWVDVPGGVNFQVHGGNVHPVLWSQLVLEDVVIVL